MKLLASCEDTGALKLIVAGHGTDTSKKDALQPEQVLSLASEDHNRHSKVLQMIENSNTKHILVTRLNGSLECYEFQSEENEMKLLFQHQNVLQQYSKEQDEKFISLEIINNIIYAGSNKGQVFVWTKEELITNTPLVYQLPISSETNIDALKVHPGGGDLIVIGGKDLDLTIYQLPSIKKQLKKTPKLIFKAKNLHDKKLDLKMKIHITNIEIDEDSSLDNFKIYTFTAFGESRYYETKLGKKPRWNHMVVPQKSSIVKSTWIKSGLKEMVISDTKAQVVQIQLQSGDQLCKFKGQFGTIQSLDVYKEKILATGGLDRYVRAYYINNRECIVKVYLGTQVNNVLILEDDQLVEKKSVAQVKSNEDKDSKQRKDKEEDADEDEEDEDDDEMWTKLEANLTQRRKKRKLVL